MLEVWTLREESYVDIPVISASRWRWQPSYGRWRRDLGLPDACTLVQVSTDGVMASEAYDFWCSGALYEFAPDRLPKEDLTRFSAKGRAALNGPVLLHQWRSSAMSGQRTRQAIERDGGEAVCIGVVVAGRRQAETGDREFTSKTGEAFVYDGGRPSRVAWTDHEGIHLTLRRPLVNSVLGPSIPSADVLTQRINANPFFAIVRDHLITIARSLDQLSQIEQVFALEQAERLVLFLLARCAGSLSTAGGSYSNLYHAAIRMIEWHLASPDLEPDWLVNRLHCSRATLYRAFAQHGDKIGAAITRLRFERAYLALQGASSDVPIAEIAARCGLYDATNFSRQFRNRFGCAPSELRESLQA